jgi:protein SDA1
MDDTLLSDLSSYRSYKDKGVMMAARSLIQLFRSTCPELLHKKDRGRPTEASAELGLRKFGQSNAREFVPGNLNNFFSVVYGKG